MFKEVPSYVGRSQGLLDLAVRKAMEKTIYHTTKSDITKHEVYTCHLVLIDTFTGNVIYSNALHNSRNTGLISSSEKDLFLPQYVERVTQLIELTLP